MVAQRWIILMRDLGDSWFIFSWPRLQSYRPCVPALSDRNTGRLDRADAKPPDHEIARLVSWQLPQAFVWRPPTTASPQLPKMRAPGKTWLARFPFSAPSSEGGRAGGLRARSEFPAYSGG